MSCLRRQALWFSLFALAIYFTEAAPLSILSSPINDAGAFGDADSGLQYLNARYYNPRLLRFITEDTYPFLNRFAYADGNPVMNEDQSGHDPTKIGQTIEGLTEGGGDALAEGMMFQFDNNSSALAEQDGVDAWTLAANKAFEESLHVARLGLPDEDEAPALIAQEPRDRDRATGPLEALWDKIGEDFNTLLSQKMTPNATLEESNLRFYLPQKSAKVKRLQAMRDRMVQNALNDPSISMSNFHTGNIRYTGRDDALADPSTPSNIAALRCNTEGLGYYLERRQIVGPDNRLYQAELLISNPGGKGYQSYVNIHYPEELAFWENNQWPTGATGGPRPVLSFSYQQQRK